MTREIAIKAIQDFIGWFKEDSLIRKALEMAIQALEQNESAEEWYKLFVKKLDEQEPCDDLVSRKAVLKLKHHKPEYGDMIYAFDVEQLPSVTVRQTQMVDKSNFDVNQYKLDLDTAYECGKASVRQTGKWIEQEGWDGDVYYECSMCGESFCLIDGTPTDNMYNYCPNCGAKMESEDKA